MPATKHPALGAASFNCPHCDAHSAQVWFNCYASERKSPIKATNPMEVEILVAGLRSMDERNAAREKVAKREKGFVSIEADNMTPSRRVDNMYLSQCYTCGEIVTWQYNHILFPRNVSATPPAEDMPLEIAADFREAASIQNASPRAAAALLRLCVQKLCKHVGEKGENINNDIKSLVAKGLDPHIQMALDYVRVIGNNAVHPGQIDLKDDHGTVSTLFELLNVIVDSMISRPKRIQAAYSQIPAEARAAIEKRDR